MQAIDEIFVSITDHINSELESYVKQVEIFVVLLLLSSTIMIGATIAYSITKSKKLITSIQVPLDEIGYAMEEMYNGNLDFELAAALRDRLFELRGMAAQGGRKKPARRKAR